MLRLFLKSLLAFVVGGLSGAVAYTAGTTSPLLQAAAGMVGYFVAEALVFRAE